MKQKLFKEFAEGYNLDEKGLTNLYESYVSEGVIPREDLADLAKVDRVEGEDLVSHLESRKELRLAIESFVSLVHDEFDYVEPELDIIIDDVITPEPTLVEYVSDYTEPAPLLESLKKDLQAMNERRWENSDKQVGIKTGEIEGRGSVHYQLGEILDDIDTLLDNIEYTLDNLENYVEEGQITPDEAKQVQGDYAKLRNNLQGLKRGVTLDIKKEEQAIDYKEISGSNLFRDLIKKEGYTMRHKYSQDLADFLSKQPESLRKPFMKANIAGSDLLGASVKVMSIINDKSLSVEQKANLSKGHFEEAYNTLDFREKVVSDVYKLVDEAHSADQPTQGQKDIIEAWKDKSGIQSNFKRFEADNLNSKQKLKDNMKDLNVLKHKDLARGDVKEEVKSRGESRDDFSL